MLDFIRKGKELLKEKNEYKMREVKKEEDLYWKRERIGGGSCYM